jgi:hypothetical protein
LIDSASIIEDRAAQSKVSSQNPAPGKILEIVYHDLLIVRRKFPENESALNIVLYILKMHQRAVCMSEKYSREFGTNTA